MQINNCHIHVRENNLSLLNVKMLRQMWNNVTNVKSYTVINEKLLALHIINVKHQLFALMNN